MQEAYYALIRHSESGTKFVYNAIKRLFKEL